MTEDLQTKYYSNETLPRPSCNWAVAFRSPPAVSSTEIKVEKIKDTESAGVRGLFGCSRGEMVKYYTLTNLKPLTNNTEITLAII